jgi:hypothetical protein
MRRRVRADFADGGDDLMVCGFELNNRCVALARWRLAQFNYGAGRARSVSRQILRAEKEKSAQQRIFLFLEPARV